MWKGGVVQYMFLSRHMKSHTREIPYKSDECSNIFMEHRALDIHMAEKHTKHDKIIENYFNCDTHGKIL